MRRSTYEKYSALTLGGMFVVLMSLLIWAGLIEVEDDSPEM